MFVHLGMDEAQHATPVKLESSGINHQKACRFIGEANDSHSLTLPTLMGIWPGQQGRSQLDGLPVGPGRRPVPYTHLTLPTTLRLHPSRSRVALYKQ